MDIQLFLDNPLLSVAAGYLIVVNVIAFAMYGMDKSAAASSKRRTPEKTLWTVALIGGSLGALAGMKFFRHKTRKVSFQFVMALIVLVQVGLVYVLLSL